jgi:hypothetical protein
MEDTTLTAYNAGANSAFVIGREGKIVARQQWCDPSGLRHWIDQAITPPAPQRTSTDA